MSVNKRYQVFVSSTYEDLIPERQAVMHSLLELDCIPSGMELFPAADDDQWTLIKGVIEECDYYIVIIAGRYGSIGPSGISYTQMEYEYALSKGKPVIAFLHKNPGSLSVDNSEQTDDGRKKLQEFRALAQKKMCKPWSSADELRSIVTTSLVHSMKTRPAVGWVKADLVPDESAAQEILRLQRRIAELEKSVPDGARPFTYPDQYYLKLSETYPRNAIIEAWELVENSIAHSNATHGFPPGLPGSMILNLTIFEVLNGDDVHALNNLEAVVISARNEKPFRLKTEAREYVSQMLGLSKRILRNADDIWILRNNFRPMTEEV